VVPGLAERELHAHATIRREWLNGELTRRTPATVRRRTSVQTYLQLAWGLLSRLPRRAASLLPAPGRPMPRGAVDPLALHR
jgi:hypothetical protein